MKLGFSFKSAKTYLQELQKDGKMGKDINLRWASLQKLKKLGQLFLESECASVHVPISTFITFIITKSFKQFFSVTSAIESLTCTQVVESVCATTVLSSDSLLIVSLGTVAAAALPTTPGSCLIETFDVFAATLSTIWLLATDGFCLSLSSVPCSLLKRENYSLRCLISLTFLIVSYL